MSKWVDGTVVGLRQWTDELYSLRVEAEIEPFTAGQFTRIALDINEERMARPYSFVNAPDDSVLEFYFITVPDGPLTQRLIHLKPGDSIHVAPRAAGFFTLNELPDAERLWMLSTGTAIGPFLSILSEPEVWKRFDRIVLVHAVRTAAELSYREVIGRQLAEHPDQLSMIPFVSREDTDFALHGRIPQAIEDGRLETCAGMSLNAGQSQVMICGNPAMVRETTRALESRGLKKNKRREPGHITTEQYWKETG